MQRPPPDYGRSTQFAKTWVQLCGGGSVFLGLVLTFMYFTVRHTPHALSTWRVGLAVTVLILCGSATLFLWRWGAVLLSLGFATQAVSLLIEGVLHVAFPWLLVLLAFVALLFSPAAATLFAWRALR